MHFTVADRLHYITRLNTAIARVDALRSSETLPLGLPRWSNDLATLNDMLGVLQEPRNTNIVFTGSELRILKAHEVEEA